MARIEYADGTFTTREPHEANPLQALPEGAELVDHGAVVTTGLPENHPTAPLGAEVLQAEGVEVVAPADAEKVENEPKAEQVTQPRRTVRTHRPKDEPNQRVGATGSQALHQPGHPKADEGDKIATETEHDGTVPQERITFGHGGEHAARGHSGGTEHPDDDNH